MQIDANVIIDKLSLQIAQQAKEKAILQVQIEVLQEKIKKLESNKEE